MTRNNIDTTKTKAPTVSGHFLQEWNMKCNDKINKGKIQHLTKSRKTISPTGNSVSTRLPPVGDSFMFTEISAKIQLMKTILLVLKEPIVFKLVK